VPEGTEEDMEESKTQPLVGATRADARSDDSGLAALPQRVPKVCGADAELGNFLLGVEDPRGTGQLASRVLLEAIDGVGPARRFYGGAYDPQDVGRKYLPQNGGCIYIDLHHIELCIPEVLSAWDHVAATHALLRIAREAQQRVNEQLPEGHSVQVLVNNSDGRSNSYGSHLSFLLTRRAWDEIFSRKLHYMLYLASFQVSSIIFTGQGKVGSENRAAATPYQLSQRADFFETLSGVQTTYCRPIVNSRDESLCGQNGHRAETESGLARLHCIFYDNNLCEVASLLKVGTMQIVLAMIEAGRVDASLMLDDPVDAVTHWSHGADLDKVSPLVSGERVTAVALQRRFHADAVRALDAGVLDTVPRADELIALWGDVLDKLENKDLLGLSGSLDWVLKRHALERVLEQRDDLDWSSPELRHLDQLYCSLDDEDGLYWAYARGGMVDQVVEEAEIQRFVVSPPDDTRAFTRAMLLRRLSPVDIDTIDWHEITAWGSDEYGRNRRLQVSLGDPLGHTRADTEHLFSGTSEPDELLRSLQSDDENAADDPVDATGVVQIHVASGPLGH
jgi:hypothetical protein